MSAMAQDRGQARSAQRLLWLVLPLLGAGYQVATKYLALDLPRGGLTPDWFAALARNPWAWTMLALEVASFFTWMAILARIKLSEAFPLSAVSYILVIAAGWTLFREPPSLLEAIGGLAILGGVWLIGSGGKAEP